MKQNRSSIQSALHRLAEDAIPSVEIDLWPVVQVRLQASNQHSSNGDLDMKRLARNPRIRLSATLILAAAILLAVVAATPSGRAWAQNLLQEAYHFFVRAESDTVPVSSEGLTRAMEFDARRTAVAIATSHPGQIILATATPDPASIADAHLSVLDVAQQVGFEVLEPTWLPDRLSFTGTSIEPEHHIVRIFYEYMSGNGLALREEPFGTLDDCELCWKVGATAEIETVQIGDLSGEYVEGVWKASNDLVWEWKPDPYLKTLRWQKDGIAFELMYMGPPDSVTKGDLIAIAESMK